MFLLKFRTVAILLCLFFATGAQAVELSWQQADGAVKSLADYKGKPVILHFWASWCPPCRSEMPGLQAWANANPDVTLIALTLDNNINDAVAFLEAKALSFPALQASTADATGLGVRGLPTTVVINGDGTIVSRKTGAVEWADAEAVAPLIQVFRAE